MAVTQGPALHASCQHSNSTNIGLSSLFLFLFDPLFYLNDRLCGLVARVPGYTTEMYCVSCEVRTGFINIRGSHLAAVMCTTVQVSDTAVVDYVTSK
jgi:hypothetical protein